ncbi:NAD(P)-binding protein [Thozetella sp. PMI_491]|nr:NAD(P)-binding protein [Thozetella sp. PMI_491]
MVGFALLGAGIFAQTEHLPAIEASSDLELKAVYSRSQKSAETIASEAKNSVDVYFDSPETPGKSLSDLLARSDIAAVAVCLPINVQPDIVKKAVEAGKHVISEKPVAKDVTTAVETLEWYKARADAPIWAVAENFRFLESLDYATAKLNEIGGQVTTFHLKMNSFVTEDNKYYNTPWRKIPEYQGGFLLDGGVHFVAALRLLLASAGQELKQLACFSALLEERLLPVDTIHAAAQTQDGKTGTIGVSFGTEFKSGLEAEIVTTKGAVTWTPTKVKVVSKSASGEKEESSKDFVYNSGVKAEFEAFGKSIVAGKGDARQTPREALKDLELLQSLLESGEGKGALKKLTL